MAEPEVKERAFQLFMQGHTFVSIAETIQIEFEVSYKAEAVSVWAQKDLWHGKRASSYENAMLEISEQTVEQRAGQGQQDMAHYRYIIDKSISQLPYLEFESAEGAVRALDLATKGQAKIHTAVVSAEFAKAIIGIIKREVGDDEELLGRIGTGIKKYVAEQEK